VPSSQRVTLGVPAYRGEPYIAETLASIQRQTHTDLEAVISLDGPQPELEEVCRPFLRDPRFRLVTQPERLGWVGNLNWLIERVETPYWCYQQQDDVLEPTYLEALVETAEHAPEAAVVYTDLHAFGTVDQVVVQPSVSGSPTGRQLTLLYEHHAAVAFRGLTRLQALRDCGRIRSNEVDSFSSDTLWMSSIARAGELHRLPEVLYHKRLHADNEHTKWARWPDETRAHAWLVHCAQMLDEAMLASLDIDERRVLWAAVLLRLTTARPAPFYLPGSSRTPEGRRVLVNEFLRYVRRRGTPDLPLQLALDDWPALRQWTRRWLRLQPAA
jgi:glycosyltransferase involved in cell wall biosynthesis